MQAHGASYLTQDLDVAYARDKQNLERLVKALAPFEPRLRIAGQGADLPFIFDARTLKADSNFTFSTNSADFDLLGYVTGIGDYEAIDKLAVSGEVFGLPIKALSLEALITSKRAAGRPKDLAVLPELEALLEAQRLADSEDV